MEGLFEDLPRSVDAEGSLLCTLLVDPTLFEDVDARGMTRKDFYMNRNAMLWDAMSALWKRDKGFDEVSILQWFKDRGMSDSFGGHMQLSKVLDRAPSTVNLQRYVQIVLEKSAKRALIHAGAEVAQLGATDIPADEAIDKAEEVLRGLNSRGNAGSGVEAHDGVRDHIEVVKAIQEGTADRTVISTGIQPLDSILGGGFRPGWQVAVMS